MSKRRNHDAPVKVRGLPMRKGFFYLVAILGCVTRKVLVSGISNTL